MDKISFPGLLIHSDDHLSCVLLFPSPNIHKTRKNTLHFWFAVSRALLSTAALIAKSSICFHLLRSNLRSSASSRPSALPQPAIGAFDLLAFGFVFSVARSCFFLVFALLLKSQNPHSGRTGIGVCVGRDVSQLPCNNLRLEPGAVYQVAHHPLDTRR